MKKHIIPKEFIFSNYYEASDPRICEYEYIRSTKCKLIIVGEKSVCSECHKHALKVHQEINRNSARKNTPAKLNAPIANTDPQRVLKTLQMERLKCRQLEQQLKEMKDSIELRSKPVDSELSKDFVTLFSGCNKKDVPPFMKLFWEEQQKYIQGSSYSSVRYHIKFCLALAAMPSSAYSELRYDS